MQVCPRFQTHLTIPDAKPTTPPCSPSLTITANTLNTSAAKPIIIRRSVAIRPSFNWFLMLTLLYASTMVGLGFTFPEDRRLCSSCSRLFTIFEGSSNCRMA
ncbi:unnamed protein product [Protopolystoma xenopodis]|uniref:Uncharacterized protein n=1 Tax=Protopolystoma xenopodis TaxID=117903 RepID=A0A448X8X5_9PLAT|nr:unnamed protein product [Protopolystoma xenopodis]